jgi:hypothetical protein
MSRVVPSSAAFFPSLLDMTQYYGSERPGLPGNVLSRPVLVTGDEEIFEGDSLFQIKCGNHWKNVGHFGHLGFIGGKPGTMKSTLLRYIAASGSGTNPLGFRLNLGGRKIMWYDGEQPDDIVVRGVRQIVKMTRATAPLESFFEMASMNHILDPRERRKALWADIFGRVDPRGETGVIIIDGIANFVNNINDFEEANTVVNQCIQVAKRLNCMVIVLAHLADRESGSKLFGALGTEVEKLASWGFHMERRGKYFVMSDKKGRYGFIAPKGFQFGKLDGTLIEEPYYPW